MKQQEFNELRKLVDEYSGISLNENKKTLLESRLVSRLKALGLTKYSDYIEYLKADSSGKERVAFVEKISTNTTHFFREAQHFDILQREIRTLLTQGKKSIRLWCGAASTGQEPWSLMMTAREAGISSSFNFRMLATDINRTVLETGKTGIYSHEEVSKIPAKYRGRNFTKVGDQYSVNKDLKGQVSFARLNLKDIPYPMSGPFDFIFIRNVMIYFDNPFREKIVAEARRLLAPNGLLFVGHAESLAGSMSTGLKKIAPSVFRKE